MSRTILCVALSLAALVTGFCPCSQGAEPRSKEEPSESKARAAVWAALAAEAKGENDERTKLLAEARQLAADLPEANWHLARVKVFGGWLPLADAEAVAASDEDRTKYDELRSKVSDVKKIRELARWCQKHGYADRARLHYAQVLAHAAADAEMKTEAVKELDLKQVGGAWLTREEYDARTEEVKQVEAGIAKWGPRLKRLQGLIDGDDFNRREQAIAEFHQIDDPALIPLLPLMMSKAGDRFQEEAVKRLATFEEYEASTALVQYAVLSNYGFVRTAAARELGKRSPQEFVPLLLGGLTAPIKTQYQVTWDAAGRVSYTHTFLREGPSGNTLLVSHGLTLPTPTYQETVLDRRRVVTGNESPSSKAVSLKTGLSRREALARQLNAAGATAAAAESQAGAVNRTFDKSNQRIFSALQESTNQQLADDPIQWWSWWQDYNQYQWPRPTTYLYQSSAQRYFYGFVGQTVLDGTKRASCFIAGTPVRTETGLQAVESIKAGDRVLAQDQDTGELTYRVVLGTTVRPPTKTLIITVGDERITTTLGHPFWVNGEGWKMAKELVVGDLLHTLAGALQIDQIEPAADAPAYNLVVDDFNTYFVGSKGVLVHDNNFRRPTRAIVPGLVRK